MKTKISLIFTFCLAMLFCAQAVPTQLEMSSEKAIAVVDYLKNQQNQLAAKAVSVGLTKKEIKTQKKLTKQISKIEKKAFYGGGGSRSWVVAVILSILLGVLGIDRFYLGRPISGILKLITIGGLGIWYLIDIVLICATILKPKNGSYDL